MTTLDNYITLTYLKLLRLLDENESIITSLHLEQKYTKLSTIKEIQIPRKNLRVVQTKAILFLK